jgi:RloB-like protein
LMRSRRRTESDLKRRTPSIEPRKRILIVCEGAKTEPYYFKGLRLKLDLSAVEVRVMGEECDSAPRHVVDYAITLLGGMKVSDSSRFDMVWCVFDVEIPMASTLPAAISKAKAYGISVALTNPCFEYWYILHFEKTAHRMQSSSEVIRYLRKHLPNYAKNDPKVIDSVYPNVKAAITRARQVIVENCYGEDLKGCNPSTHVHRVVNELLRISKLRRYPQ